MTDPTVPVTRGQLWLVATPIGNLGDLTARARQVLEEADVLVAEDTRRLRALLSHLGIGGKRLRALHAHSDERDLAPLIEELALGATLAYTTDAGTPGVSDPGRRLVEGAAARGLQVSCVPGPSAVTAAVALSALVDGPFQFLGFLPRKGAERQARVRQLENSPDPTVVFEAPSRMADTLEELAQRMPDRAAYVGRELTKLHEESLRGTLAELASPRQWRGELVMVIAGAPASSEPPEVRLRQELIEASLVAALRAGAAPGQLARALSETMGLPRSPLYQRALELAQTQAEDRHDPVPSEE